MHHCKIPATNLPSAFQPSLSVLFSVQMFPVRREGRDGIGNSAAPTLGF